MIVRSLELREYRNYEDLKVEFDPGTNLIYGDNAQGKTNVLEAIFECAIGRSHRGSKDKEIVRFGEEEGHIRLVMEKNSLNSRIDLHFGRSRKKGAAVDGVPLKRLSDLFGLLNVVFFSPEDLKIIKSSPQERRRFMDMELCQLSKLYTHNLGNFNKCLMQRNDLLKEEHEQAEMRALLDVWDSQLVKFGTEVITSRAEFAERIAAILEPIHRDLSGGKESLKLEYAPDTAADRLEERLFLARDNDLYQKTTTVGPQRDDLEFYINGIDVKKYGSQGQQRTAALALKLAEIELVRQTIGDSPVLLLDDVLSELDSSRQERLLKSLKDTQTFLTCTGLDDFVERSMDVAKKFKVTEGNMTEETRS